MPREGKKHLEHLLNLVPLFDRILPVFQWFGPSWTLQRFVAIFGAVLIGKTLTGCPIILTRVYTSPPDPDPLFCTSLPVLLLATPGTLS